MCVCECAIISFTGHSQWLQRIFYIILHLSPILLFFSCFLWHLFSFLVNIWYFGFCQFWYAMIDSCRLSVCLCNHCLWWLEVVTMWPLVYLLIVLCTCMSFVMYLFYFHYTEINIKSQYWQFCLFLYASHNLCIVYFR